VGNQFTTEGELGDESDIKLACITPGMALILVEKPLPSFRSTEWKVEVSLRKGRFTD